MAEYITREGMKRLEKKLNIILKERPGVIVRVQIAREMGDLSENAEYQGAKERQRQIDTEVDRIKRRMAVLKVVDPASIPKDAIRFGACVRAVEESSEEEFNYMLVGVDEVYQRDDDVILISVASPIGKAMIGKKKNENFTVFAPIGNRIFKILEIN